MGTKYDALNGEEKRAVEWKAKQNLSMALAGGNEMALRNQSRFLDNNMESLANNAESVRNIVQEFREFSRAEDD